MTRDVVLLNGWGMTKAAWQPLLADLPCDWTTHALDLHELGVSGSAGLGDFVRAAAARAPECCDVIAWSLGAQIALRWAHDRPGQLGRLALLAATPCFVGSADWPHGMDAAVFDDFATGVRNDAAGALARFALLQAKGDVDAGAVARTLRAALCRDAGALNALQAGLECLRRTDLRMQVAPVSQATLLLHGANDGLVPVAAGAWLRGVLPAGGMKVFSGAAHAPHVSAPKT
ncbi:MAG TPA: alpha/beta fold hydrolase, partial [Burkholderiales bacterium]|nr:alpha/beta fold hydrolase [Burkholderiales bacterium]